MDDPRCLYTLLRIPRERHDELLLDFVVPVTREIRGCPELFSLFFARYNVPVWELRFRILGEPGWVDGPVRQRVERALAELEAAGRIEGYEFATYDREVERYGGPEGMALAERVFLADSLACLDWLAAEAAGELGRSRREIALVFAEKLLDLLGFDRAARLAFYRYGYQWALDMGTWEKDDRALLEERYQELKPALAELFGEKVDPALLWGGERAAAIGRRCLAELAPTLHELRAAHADGRIAQDLGYLAWSYTHMHCNRLGIDPNPEAILRFFMHRFHQDRA
jgi:thiopeptide-type bacteriocin biosynthesis protein